MARYVSPVQAEYNDNGAPLDGAKLFFFVGALTGTGSSTPQDTFADAALTIPNSNPVVADANGRFTDNIFLDPSLLYRVVMQDKYGVQIFDKNPYTVENGLSEWQQTLPAIKLTDTSYRYENIDRTSSLSVGQRVYMQGGADRYATIISFSFSTHTDVTVIDVTDSTETISTVNAGMTSASLAFIDSLPKSVDSRGIRYYRNEYSTIGRSVYDQIFNDSISIEEFKYAGESDYTNALNRAGAASVLEAVRFPEGTYNITNEAVLYDDTKWLAVGDVTINKTTNNTAGGVNNILRLGSGAAISNIEISGFRFTGSTATGQGESNAIYAIDGYDNIRLTDLRFQNIKYALRFGGGYQVNIRNLWANGPYTAYEFNADLSAGISNVTSVFAHGINMINGGHGLKLNKVIYSSFVGYIDGPDTAFTDLYVANETPVAIETTNSDCNLHIGGERIGGIFHASSGSYGQAQFHLVAGASDQFLPDAARTANGYVLAEQAYFSYVNSSWVLSGPNMDVGDATWSTPATKTKFVYLDTNAYIKFLAGYCLLETSKMDVVTGTNSEAGWANESCRFLGNYQGATSDMYHIGNDLLVFSDTVAISGTTVSVTFSPAFDSTPFFANATVIRDNGTAYGGNIASTVSASSASFTFNADLTGYSAKIFAFGKRQVP